MDIRRAQPQDVESIVDVHGRSSIAAYADLPASTRAVTADARRLQWRATLAEADSWVWVALEAGTVIGFCHLRIVGPVASGAGGAEITTLYVAPERWRRGVGRALVDRARHAAADLGCARLFLKVYAENRRARAAYEAMGFSPTPGTSVHKRTGMLLKEYELALN